MTVPYDAAYLCADSDADSEHARASDRQSLGLGVTHTAQEGGALGCGGPRADSESVRRGRVPGVRCTTQATRAEQESNALSASRSTG